MKVNERQVKDWQTVSTGAGNTYTKKIEYYGNGDCSWKIIKKLLWKIDKNDSLIAVVNKFWGTWVQYQDLDDSKQGYKCTWGQALKSCEIIMKGKGSRHFYYNKQVSNFSFILWDPNIKIAQFKDQKFQYLIFFETS